MKYVVAVLFALNALASTAQADACQDTVTQFLIAIAGDKKDEALKLIVPTSQVYKDIQGDLNKAYSLLLRERFSAYQRYYNNSFVIEVDASYPKSNLCSLQIFGIQQEQEDPIFGPSPGQRIKIGFAHVTKSPKVLIENIRLGSDL